MPHAIAPPGPDRGPPLTRAGLTCRRHERTLHGEARARHGPSGALSRRSGRGGGTTLPGRMLVRMAPDAIDRLAVQLDRGSIVVSSTNGKTTTAGMIAGDPARPRATPRSTTAPAPTCTGASPRRCSSSPATRACSSSTRPGCRGSPRSCARACWSSATSSATSSTATASWSGSRTSGPSWWPRWRARCEFALNADDPLIADLGRDRELRRRPGVTYFGIEDTSQALPELQHAHDAKHCRRCGAPYSYERAFVGHLGHYRCPNCDADRPTPDIAATEIELHGICGLPRAHHDARGRAGARPPPPRPLQRLQRPGRRRRRSSLGCPAPTGARRPRVDARRLRPCRDDRGLGQARLDPPDQEPGRRQRGAPHADARVLERRASTSGSRSTTESPTAATSRGSGTRTSSCSRRRSAA